MPNKQNVYIGGNHQHVHMNSEALALPRPSNQPPPLPRSYIDAHAPTLWERFEPLRWMLLSLSAFVLKVSGAIVFKVLHIGLIVGERSLGAGRISLEQLALKSEWKVLRPCLPTAARKELPRDC